MHVNRQELFKLVTSFDEIFIKTKHVVSMAIYKCKIYKNREHYEQIGYIALWNAYNQFDGVEEEFEPYAYVFVKNAILNELKTMSRYESRHVFYDQSDAVSSTHYCEEPNQNLTEYINELLKPLKEEDRQMLLALYVYQYSYEEVAEALNISVHALKKRRDRVMRKLRSYKEQLFNDYNQAMLNRASEDRHTI